MEGFDRKKGGAWELLVKEKKGFTGDIFPLGGEKGRIFCNADCLFLWGGEGPRGQSALLVLDQKIADWVTKITFLGEVGSAVRSDIKSRFGIMGFF